MIREPFVASVLAASALVASMAYGQAPYANTARDLAANCANCHGTEGRAVAGMPRLAGRPAADLSRAMKEFRDGRRPGTVMPQLAKGYTDVQIDAIARYLAGMPREATR